jgi:hypothetical protein
MKSIRERVGSVVAVLVAALLVTGCVSKASPPTTSSPALTAAPSGVPPTQRALQSSTPRPPAQQGDLGCAAIPEPPGSHPGPIEPSPPTVTIAKPDRASAAAIQSGVAALTDLRSYKFSMDVVGLDLQTLGPSTIDIGARGTVSHEDGLAIDAIAGSRIREPDGSAAVSGSFRLLAGNGWVWSSDNVSGVLEPSPVETAGNIFAILAPEALASRVVTPFGGGFTRAGTERHGKVPTVHYHASTAGATAYRRSFRFPGKIDADMWLAADGGRLVGARIKGTASRVDPSSGANVEIPLLVSIEITDPDNPANVIARPVPPVPDPVRARGLPVDLQLGYRVLPTNGRVATAAEIDEMTVTLRVRLDVSSRRIKVDVAKPDKIIVTICHTISPDADRRLVQARGALTVVPLPAGEYGTTTRSGPRSLPAVGETIDQELAPIAPAARVGLSRSHVDPATGHRGLAFVLSNQASETFRTYAAAHPDEHVAIVMDGVALAVLAIDDNVSKGHFAFTGDYTEGEAKLLAGMLYRDPLPFDLEKTDDVEFVSQ